MVEKAWLPKSLLDESNRGRLILVLERNKKSSNIEPNRYLVEVTIWTCRSYLENIT
jgi:hypothetical protein